MAHLDGESVQWRDRNYDWNDWSEHTSWCSEALLSSHYQFRLKPRTITINGIECPAPLKQKSAHSNWDKTFVLRVGRCEYEYENEQDYILVRDTLENIFK